MRGADARARQHRNRKLDDHRHVDGDAIAFFHAQLAQPVREAADLIEQLSVGDGPAVAGLALVIERDLGGFAGPHVPVERIDRCVEFAVAEPARERLVPLEDLLRRRHPLELVGPRFPPGQIVALGLLVDAGLGVGPSSELRRRGEPPGLRHEGFDGVVSRALHIPRFSFGGSAASGWTAVRLTPGDVGGSLVESLALHCADC